MLRAFSLRSSALALLLLLPALPLALLCRGRIPNRFDPANLPAWERRLPPAAPACGLFRLTPLAPGAVRVPNNPWVQSLLTPSDNSLLAGAEHPGTGDAGLAGRWLEAACGWGRNDRRLAAKQDRVALRLLAAQDDAGRFGLPAGGSHGTKAVLPYVQTDCLRGLTAYYTLTHQAAALYAAQAGSKSLLDPRQASVPGLVFGLTRLAQAAGDTRLLSVARRRASGSDGLGLCALYEATGDRRFLSAAQGRWKRGDSAAQTTSELLLLTGQAQYATALSRSRSSVSTRAAWSRAPLGMAVSTLSTSSADFRLVHLSQQTAGGLRTITVSTPKPVAFALRVFLPPGPASVISIDGRVQTAAAKPERYAVLVRRWHQGDTIEIKPGTQSAGLDLAAKGF